jgi:cyanophycin synthetase
VNIGSEFLEVAGTQPERIALLICDANGQASISFARLRSVVLRHVALLHGLGLRAGDLVLLQGTEPIEDMVLFLALTLLGVGVFAPGRATEAEHRVVTALGIRHVVTVSGANDFGLLPIAVAPPAFAASGAEEEAAAHLVCVDGTRLWLLRSSSGTTGTPKIVVTSHDYACARRSRYREAVSIEAGDVFCSLTPVSFGAARQRVVYALGAGATVVLVAETSLSSTVRQIRAAGVTHLYAVPMYLEQLCDLAASPQRDEPAGRLLPAIKSLETSSSTVTPLLREKVHRLVSPQLHISYAASEVGHMTSTARSQVPEDTLGSVGKPLRGLEMAIFDAEMKPVPTGVSGAIGVRFPDGPSELHTLQVDGSWTLATRGGWFFPGDVGHLSASGNLIFQGRSDDMMIFNGINIFPAEIEAVACAHPSVKEAAAFSVPSRISKDLPCVALVRFDDGTSPDFAEYFRKHLGTSRPRAVFFVPALPRNAMGKVLVRELRERALAQLTAKKLPNG